MDTSPFSHSRSANETSMTATTRSESATSSSVEAMSVSDSNASTTGSTTTAVPAKGRNVSGRSWKTLPQKRASSLVKTSFNNQSSTWERKVADKRRRQEASALQKEIKEEKRQEAIQKKQRRLDNEKRRAENELKSVQNSLQHLNEAKIGVTLKAMSKKQLRMVKKTRMNQKTGVVEYVPAYAK